jgi:FkbM family methyltransferase
MITHKCGTVDCLPCNKEDYEEKDTKFLLDYCFTKDNRNKNIYFLDVGAHVGLHALRIYNHFNKLDIKRRTPVILCYEPQGNNYDSLSRNSEGNFACFKIALSNYKSTAYLKTDEEHFGGFYLNDEPNDNPCLVDYLDNRLAPFLDEDVLLLKVDVEGSEFDTLLGAEKILHDTKNVVAVVELCDAQSERFGNSSEEVVKLMRRAGFNYYNRHKKTYHKSIFNAHFVKE